MLCRSTGGTSSFEVAAPAKLPRSLAPREVLGPAAGHLRSASANCGGFFFFFWGGVVFLMFFFFFFFFFLGLVDVFFFLFVYLIFGTSITV